MKRNIVICEYISTGVNYIDDVRARGYEPVLLEGHYIKNQEEEEHLIETRNTLNKRFEGKYKIIHENPDYEEVLGQVRALDPAAVIAGSEFGVPLAVRLAEDLRLVGNPLSRLRAMTEKDAMQEAIKEHGLRYIRGRIIKDEADAATFYHTLGTEDIVIKRTRGAASQGVYLCHGYEDTMHAVRQSFADLTYAEKDKTAVMMQERIIGTEYIVNTVSCRGRHRVVSIWKYDKIKMPNGASAYNNMRTVSELEIGYSELVRYACKVASAIGVENGPIHGEYMIDKNGPVLIEVNCRPMGGGLMRNFTEQIFGHHETDVVLDSVLDPAKFNEDFYKSYRPKKSGAVKMIILAGDTRIDSSPILQIATHLRSYYSASFEQIGKTETLPETTNLETSGGYIYLLHEDESLVRYECELLHLLEERYPQILFQSAPSKVPSECPKPDPEATMKATNCHGATLIFSDTATHVDGAMVVSADELQDAYDSYENGILDISDPRSFEDLESVIQLIFTFISKIRPDGRIIVPESTYCHLPYGIEGIEILLRVAGLRIELPLGGIDSVLIASVQ